MATHVLVMPRPNEPIDLILQRLNRHVARSGLRRATLTFGEIEHATAFERRA
jgi:hypothetical protein